MYTEMYIQMHTHIHTHTHIEREIPHVGCGGNGHATAVRLECFVLYIYI